MFTTVIQNKWLRSLVTFLLIAVFGSNSTLQADDQGEKNDKNQVVRRSDMPKKDPLSKYYHHTYDTQMKGSIWQPGDGDKPRISSEKEFIERLEHYHAEQLETIEGMREHQIYWEMANKKQSDDDDMYDDEIIIYAEEFLPEISILVSEGSYVQAAASTIFSDHYRFESWLLTRGIRDPVNYHDYIRERPGHFFKRKKILAGNGIDIVKAYYNAVTNDLEGYKNLGKQNRLLKDKLKTIAREHHRLYLEISNAARNAYHRKNPRELIKQNPDILRAGFSADSLDTALNYKQDLELVRKRLILNIKTEAKVGELLTEARHWARNPWDLYNRVVLPNIDPNTHKAYKINFIPVNHDEYLLYSEFDITIKPPKVYNHLF